MGRRIFVRRRPEKVPVNTIKPWCYQAGVRASPRPRKPDPKVEEARKWRAERAERREAERRTAREALQAKARARAAELRSQREPLDGHPGFFVSKHRNAEIVAIVRAELGVYPSKGAGQ